MKTILTLSIALFVIVSCSPYTVKVNVDGVKINDEDVEKGACREYSDSLFGLMGDFPINIQTENQEKSVEYEANNYEVTSNGVQETDSQCETAEDEDTTKKPATEGEEGSNVDDTKPATEGEEGSNVDDTKPATEGEEGEQSETNESAPDFT